MSLDPADLLPLVRAVVGRVMAERGRAEHPAGPTPSLSGLERPTGVHVSIEPQSGFPRPGSSPAARKGRPELITEADLACAVPGSVYEVPPGALVTPAARDVARARRLVLQSGSGAFGELDRPLRRVALGADHGGVQLKAAVTDFARDLGWTTVDLGTQGNAPVDYPDFALAVAQAVREGRVELGICIDGAGLGSAMAANKVPGVRAAPCTTVELAKNAREHNFANVLTLGSKHVSLEQACQIVRAFLSTPTGEQRHAKRVAKLGEIEAHYHSRPRGTPQP